MPFLTEEVWHAVYEGNPPYRSIALSSYPAIGPSEYKDLYEKSDHLNTRGQISQLQNLINAVRNLRKLAEVPERELAQILIPDNSAHDGASDTFRQNREVIKKLARVSGISFQNIDQAERKIFLTQGRIVQWPSFDVVLLYERTIDITAKRERLTKDIAKYVKGLESADRQLGNDAFLAKAPSNVVEGLKKQQAEMRQLLEKAKAALDALPPE